MLRATYLNIPEVFVGQLYASVTYRLHSSYYNLVHIVAGTCVLIDFRSLVAF